MTKINYYQLFTSLFFGAAIFVLSSCEGPAGPAGKDGLAGEDGKDANETCKKCHNPGSVDAKKLEYEFSKHSFGEAAFEEGGNTGCTPCHTTAGFHYVCKNNISAAYVLQSGSTTKYSNGYNAVPGATLGEMTCVTCHPNIHKTYDSTDYYPLTNVNAVPMSMWAGTKTITLTQKGGESHLCVKCHQPRAINTNTTVGDGKPVDYEFIAATANHAALFWDSTSSAPKKVAISYRTHVHYGTAGAIFAGVGGVQIPGSLSYTNSIHSSSASCQDCHMAPLANRAGGHTFMVRGTAGALGSSTTWNFNGCNTSGCHTAMNADGIFKTTRSEIKGLLEQLGAKLKNGVGGAEELMHKNSDAESNPWAGITSKNYDGYWDIYDPSTNPDGIIRNPSPSSSWTTAQKSENLALPRLKSITNLQMAAIINFQLCLREYSLGVHNYAYTKALLKNSIDALTAAGF